MWIMFNICYYLTYPGIFLQNNTFYPITQCPLPMPQGVHFLCVGLISTQSCYIYIFIYNCQNKYENCTLFIYYVGCSMSMYSAI